MHPIRLKLTDENEPTPCLEISSRRRKRVLAPLRRPHDRGHATYRKSHKTTFHLYEKIEDQPATLGEEGKQAWKGHLFHRFPFAKINRPWGSLWVSSQPEQTRECALCLSDAGRRLSS